MVGVGWRLSGGSVIELTPGLELLGFDYFLGVQYSLAGAGSLYTLDGQQLIPCGSQTSTSPSCEPGARTAPTDPSMGVVNYSTLSETYLKIEYVDAGTGEWNVWQKNGTKLVYLRQGTSKFLLRTVTDPSGNTVSYEWSVPQPNNNVQFNRLDAITYNGTVIKFYYGSRTLQETYASDYVLETMDKVLVAIDVCVGPTSTSTTPCALGVPDARRARTYALDYRDSRGTGRPLLSSVQMFGKNAVLNSAGIVQGGTSLPAMTFSYNDVTPSFSTTEIMAVSDWGEPTSRGMVDWDGDGAKDFCRIIGNNNFVTCMFGSGGGLWGARGDVAIGGTAQNWGEPSTRGYADWDGDGKADFCRLTCKSGCGVFQTKTWQITCSFSDGTSMTDLDLGTIPQGTDGAAGERFWVDWNGDGKTDFCRKAIDQNTVIGGPYGHYNAGWFCAISNGRSGQQHRFIGALEDYASANNGFPIATVQGTQAVVDFNGDGRADYCRIVNGGSRLPGGPNPYKMLCLLGAPAKFDGSAEDVSHDYPMAETGFNNTMTSGFITSIGQPDAQYWVDVNGDGKTDYCRIDGSSPQINPAPLYCNISKQNTSTQVIWGTLNNAGEWKSRRWGDLNGDGKADFCRQIGFTGAGKICGTSEGVFASASVNTMMTSVPSHDTKHWMVDWNGDGRHDYCFNGGSAGGSGSSLYCLHRDGSEMADLMTGVKNGIGSDSFITYAPSAEWTRTSWQNNNPPIIPTVLSVRDMISGAVTSYRYSGGRFDWKSGRFLGFGWARTTKPCNANETLCPYTETRSGLDARFPSKPLEVTDFVQTPSGTPRMSRRTLYGYTHVYGAANVTSPFRSDLVSELVEEYDDAGQNRSTLRTRTYDRYGNITIDDDHGLFFDSTAPAALTGGDDRRFDYQYFPNIAGYIVDKPGRIRSLSGLNGALLTDKVLVYDNASSITTPPTRGLPTSSFDLLDTTGYIQTTKAYDVVGNLIAETDANQATTTYVVDPIFRQYVIKKILPPAGGRASSPISFKWLATDCMAGNTITFRINGSVAYTGTAASDCTCDPGVKTVTVTDPAVVSLVSAGSNTFSVQYEGHFLAWAKANLGSQGDVIVFDEAAGDDATEEVPNLCTAGYAAALGTSWSKQATLSPPASTPAFSQSVSTAMSDLDVQCGQRLRVTQDQDGTGAQYKVDALCRPIEMTRPRGGRETIAYVDVGSPTSQHTLVSVDTGSGTTWKRIFFDHLGRTRKVTRQGPVVGGTEIVDAEYSYTPRGQRDRTYHPRYANSGAWYYTFREYDALDRVQTITTPGSPAKRFAYPLGAVEVTDEMGHTQATWYDVRGNPVRTCTKGPNGCLGDETTYEYDARGYPSRVVQQLGAPGSGRVTTSQFLTDSFGRRFYARDPDAGARWFEYDLVGNLVREVDATGDATRTTYDALHRRTSQTLHDCTTGNCWGPPPVTSTWSYDEQRPGVANVGRLTSTTDPSGAARYDYDGDGNLISAGRTVDGNAFTFGKTYDLAGRLLTTAYPDGTTVGTLGYDGAGRVQTIPGFVTYAEYDASNNLARYDAANGTSTIYDTATPRADLRGYQTWGPRSAPGKTAVLGTYARGRTTSATPNGDLRNYDEYRITMRTGETLTVSTCATAVNGASGTDNTLLRLFDAVDKEVAVNDDAGGTCGLLSTITHTATKTGVHTVRAGCFEETSCSATVAYRLTDVSGALKAVSAQPVLQDVKIVRDYEGRIQHVTSNRPHESWEYRYSNDGLHQLTYSLNSLDHSFSEANTYDPTGNLTSSWGPHGTYAYPSGNDPDQPHAVIATDLGAFTYDAAGRMTSSASAVYAWDGGRLRSARNWTTGTSTSFTYDADGFRLKTYSETTSTSAIYLGDNYEHLSWHHMLFFNRKHITLGGRLVARTVGGTATTWLYTDHRGSVSFGLENGTPIASQSYRPWGASIIEGLTTWLRGYTGQVNDESGLLYLHARFYDPQLGRFLSSDPTLPTLHSVGRNRYAYAQNDPANRTDINGMGDWQDFLSAVNHGTGEWASAVRKVPMIGGTLALLPTTIGAISRGDGETVAKSMTSEFLMSNAIAVSIILSAASYGGLSPALYTGLSFLNAALTTFSLTMIETDGDVLTSVNRGVLSGMFALAGQGLGVLWDMAAAEIHAALRPDQWYALTGNGGWALIDSILTPATGVTVFGWSKTVLFGLVGGPDIARDSHDQATDSSKMGLASSASGTKFGYGYEQDSTVPAP